MDGRDVSMPTIGPRGTSGALSFETCSRRFRLHCACFLIFVPQLTYVYSACHVEKVAIAP